MTTPDVPQRREVHYEGRVQGVGFRYRTQTIAQKFPVLGFVKNLSDGRVLLVIEGRSIDLDRLLAEIDAEMRGNIHAKSIVLAPATGEFRNFSILR